MSDEPEDDDTTSDRKMDEELKAIGAILRELRKLPDDARPRVVAYIASRFKETP